MNTLPPLTGFGGHQYSLLGCHGRSANANSHITAAVRRHKRQRHRQGEFPVPGRPPSQSDDRIEIITFDMKRMREGATEAVKKAEKTSGAAVSRLKGSVSEFWKDLRKTVIVSDQGFAIVVRYSTIQFFAGALLCSVFAAVFYKFIRARIWEWRADGSWVLRRDRSLAGKEVVVSRRRSGPGVSSASYGKGLSPLATSDWESRSEKELLRHREKRGSVRKEASVPRLPSWWPPPDIRPATSSQDSAFGQLRANALRKAIENGRMSGRDFSEEEFLQLRQICKTSGVTVSFQTVNVRDSLYRAAIDFVLTTCSSSPHGSSSPQIGGEEAARFLSGLAENIGIKADRAAIMVNAAVASRTRSSFLQAWALIMQGNYFEAHVVLRKISQIHSTFPPETNSPEIEMVAEGLKNHINLEERKQLLNMFTEVCGSSNQRVAVEALGLVSTWEGTNNKFSR
ncbi:uncharacterized protein LOC131036109 [Cryptomeria japonica]|uniref:uncharacterized protein LOC131036109 n=1 Tax=Cryptomeria japonica TaxID=3369 RepID=UPI0027DA1463|nr:uncharacterized protein LOC131036109 [Cryptomeria japonica]